MSLLRIEQYKRQRGADRAGHARRASLELFSRGTAIQPQNLRRQRSAVLDCVNAGLKRGLHTLGALDMGHDRKANLVRRLARRRSDIDRHAQHAWLAYFGRVEHTTRHEQLDDVGAARIQVAHLLGRLAGGIGDLRKEARAVAIRAP